MKSKAIWIIDDKFIVPAFLSISSFVSAIEMPIVIVFCGDIKKKEAKKLFLNIHPLVTFEEFKSPIRFEEHPNKAVITNRLARIQYAVGKKNEVIYLFDADTLFTNKSGDLIKEVENEIHQNDSIILGVLDAQVAYRDYLYFRTKDTTGRDVVVPHLLQKDIYNDVFGSNWWHHLKGPSINNGVIAFYNCKALIEVWKTNYLKGIEHIQVNAGDDQLPLAAAIHKTNQKIVCLSEIYNSKGKVSGDYKIYHALSSMWIMQIKSAINGEQNVSDFADLAKSVLSKTPKEFLLDFTENHIKSKPYLFRKLSGKFGFQHLYEDIISGISDGTVVEVGLKQGKSTCFMAELIKNKQKNIQFLALGGISEPEKKLAPLKDILDSFDLTNYIHFIDNNNTNIIDNLTGIDFVFLNLENDYKKLINNLNFWFPKLKSGGIIAGYDNTSQIGLNYGNECATYDFCKLNGLSLRISFNIFIIEKPTENMDKSKTNIDQLLIKEPIIN